MIGLGVLLRLSEKTPFRSSYASITAKEKFDKPVLRYDLFLRNELLYRDLILKVSQREISTRMNRFVETCRASGAKLTHQRMEIFREVAQAIDHPDAEKVYRRVRKRVPTVSLDTVYRTLRWLEELGFISTLGPLRERARFDGNLRQHHHFVCVRCGLTRDFYSDHLNNLELPESVKAIGRVETMQVEVNGVCYDCAAKRNNKAKKQKRRRERHE